MCFVWTAKAAISSSDVDVASPFTTQQNAALMQQSSACDAWLPDLMKIKVWRSAGSRCQQDITVTTQLSMDRYITPIRLITAVAY